MRKVALATAASLTAAVAVATPAMATMANVGGGTWWYGVQDTVNYSDYYHPSNKHRSSVISDGILTRSSCTAPGDISYASTYAGFSGNKAYWNNSC
jgi:lactococcin 972 family bacteriocin